MIILIVKIFVETQEPLKRHPKHIGDRILLALGVNPTNQFNVIDWEHFKSFKSLLVSKDTSLEEMVDFVLRVIITKIITYFHSSLE